MLFETLGQARIFLWMTAAGAGLSMLYDLFCLAGSAFGRRGEWVSAALFAAGAGALLFLGMKRVQMSGLRAYVLLGAAVGWFLYAASVSRFFRWTAEKIGNYRRKKETANV